MRTSLALAVLAVMTFTACSSTGKMGEMVVAQERPIVVHLRPAQHYIYRHSSRGVLAHSDTVEVADEWDDVIRPVYEEFRDEFGDQVVLVTGSRRVVEDEYGREWADWSEYGGHVLVQAWVAASFQASQDVTDEYTYRPELYVRAGFYELVDQPASELVVPRPLAGITGGQFAGRDHESFTSEERLTLEEALELYDFGPHRDELRAATREATQEYLANVLEAN